MSKRAWKPTIVKGMEGNRGKRPLPENEPKPKPISPKICSDLSSEAKRVWKKLAPKLERLKLLTEADGDMFGGLCQLRARLEWIRKELRKKDNEKKWPFLMKEERLYSALFRMYAREFGLSPVGRIGLTIDTEKDDDDFEKLLD